MVCLPKALGARHRHSLPQSTKQPQATSSEEPPAAYPKNWDDVDVGSLVLVKEDGPWRSWWEGVPIAKADDQFLLQWRGYPEIPNVKRSRLALALLYPNGH